MESILSMIKSGSNATSIQLYVKSTHHINIDYHMIYKIRSSHINELISQCSTNPYGSTVDNLIALFKATDHVSCVYLLHNFDSGFVTYRKNASSKNVVETENQTSSANGYIGNKDSIDNWRNELCLEESNDILVAFAWAHDEEIKSAEMFPELFGIDVTFGVNRERRELLIAAGIGGTKKIFTALYRGIKVTIML